MKSKTLISVMSALVYFTPQLKAQGNFTNVQAGQNVSINSPALQAEGRVRIPQGSVYGVGYIDKDKKDNVMFRDFYTELRFTYDLKNLYSRLENLGVAAELNSGNHFDDRLRLGLTYEADPRAGNHITIKFLPINKGHDKESQLSMFVSQAVGRSNLSALGDYNLRMGNDTFYFEPQFDFKLRNRMMFFAQARFSQSEDENKDKKRRLETIVGIKIPVF